MGLRGHDRKNARQGDSAPERPPCQLYLISPLDVGGDFPDRLAACSKDEVNAAVAGALQPDDLCVVVVASAAQMRAPLEAIGFDDVQVVDYRSY